MQRGLHYIHFVVAPTTGIRKPIPVTAKSIDAAPNENLWELRRFLLVFDDGKEPSEVITRDRRRWCAMFAARGLQFEDHFRASERSCKSRGVQFDEEHDKHALISSHGLLLLMAHWSDTKRGEGGPLSLALLRAFLHRIIPIEYMLGDLVDFSAVDPRDHGPGMCNQWHAVLMGNMAVCACVHEYVQASRQQRARAHDQSSHSLLAGDLVCMVKKAIACPSLQQWLGRKLDLLSLCLSTCVALVSETDPLKAPGVVLKGDKRNRAADPDLVHAVSMLAMENKKAKTSAQFCNATDLATSSTVAHFDVVSLSQRQAACMMTFQRVGSCSISSDASRVGEPKEEVIFGSFWSALHDVGDWLPPQVPNCLGSTWAQGP